MSLKPTIEKLRSLGHHQTVYDWGIQFIGLPSGISGFSSSDLNTRCTSATLPSREIAPIEINLRGHKIFQHGIVNYKNTLTLNLYETVDSKVREFLKQYMDMQWMPVTGVQMPKSLNQCSFLLTLLDSEQKTTSYYTIIGAWLQNFTPSGELGGTSDVLSYQCTFQYDYYI